MESEEIGSTADRSFIAMLSSTSFSGSNTFNVGGSILDFSNFNIVQRFSDGNNGFVSIFVRTNPPPPLQIATTAWCLAN